MAVEDIICLVLSFVLLILVAYGIYVDWRDFKNQK